jgi:hypothetical protein
MQLNLGKCKCMSFSRSRFTRHFRYELSGHRLDTVYSICDLGVVLESKLNFTSHIDSLIVKASRMLSYIRRNGKEFRDPYSLKTLYNSFVRSVLFGLHKRHVEPVLRRAFEKNRGYPEVVFEIHVAYAWMEPRYRTTSVLSTKVPFD